jgi:hypothetical protein
VEVYSISYHNERFIKGVCIIIISIYIYGGNFMKKLEKSRKNRLVRPMSFTVAIFIAALMVLSSFGSAAGVFNLSTQSNLNKHTQNSVNQLDSAFSLEDSRVNPGSMVPTNPTPAPLGTPILTEDFEGNVMPPTGWTHIQYNPVQTWVIDNYDPHSGTYYADCEYDSTYTTTQDEWLITPSLDFTAYDQVTLSFWWLMSYYWGVTPYDNYDLNVKVSTDGGTTWTLVWNEDSIGVFTSWLWYDTTFGTPVDLSAYTSYSDVKIGFQYEGYDGAELALDDVTITGIILGADDVGVLSIDAPVTGDATGPITPTATVKNFGSSDQTDVPVDMTITKYGSPSTVWSSGFETYSIGYYGMPAGWTTVTTNPTGTWYMYSSSTTYSASTYPRVQESLSDGNAQDESLISPVIDCSALAAVRLSFTKYFYASVAADATFTVYGSDDGGLTWGYTLVTYSSTSSTTETLDITSWAAGQNDVRFRFRFESPADASLTSYLYFDNMWVGHPTPGDWGTYGDNPPVGWTIERKDTTAWDYNHWHRYAYSSYDMYGSAARMYYASPYPEIDDNLTSPSIDCSALATVILQFNCYFYSYTSYNNEMYVQASIDGGDWQNIDDYRITPPGSYGYCIWYEYYNGYDITALAAGHSNVKIRYHFTRPAAATYGYTYIDNFRIGDGSGTFKYIETFDTGRAVYFTVFKEYIHDNWGGWDWRPIREPYYNNKWQNLASGSTPTCTPIEGSFMAQYYSYIYQGMKGMLYSFPIDVSATNTLKMSFWMFHDTIAGAGSVDVVASHDGHTWTTLATFNRNDGSPNGWYQHVVNLPGYEDDTALQIGFLCTSDYVAYMYFDDVELFDPGLVVVYTDTQYVDIDAGQSVQVDFSTWTPGAWHTQENIDILYDVNVETSLVGDSDPTNDAMLETVSIHYPFFHDIQVLSIDSPNADGPGVTQEVKATIKNIGQYAERNFFVPTQIGEKVYTTTGYYNNFEANDGGFTQAGGQWAWGTPTSGPGAAYSGTKLWATVLGGNYVAGLATLDTVPITVPTGGDLSFWLWYDYEASYDGLNVQISTDSGTTWTLMMPAVGPYTGSGNSANPLGLNVPCWTGHVQGFWEYIEFDLAAYEGMSVMFRFASGADTSVFYPGAYIDDILVGNLVITIVPEYDESAAVANWLYPGETLQLTYPDWTPANLGIGTSGDFEYGIKTIAQNTPDGDTSNNEMVSTVILSFWHDVGVKTIVSPSKGTRDLLFHQRPFLSTESWTFRSSSAGGGYLCQDNFNSLTAPIGNIEFWGLCLIYNAGWTPGNQNTIPFQVKFYEDNAGAPGTEVASFDLAASTPVQFEATGAYSGFTAYKWTYDLPTAVPLANGWISIQSQTAPDNAWILWAGSPEGDLNMWQQGATTPHIAGDCAFNLSGTASPIPPIQLYLAPGSQPISSIVNNLGVFSESGLTCYAEIWDFTADPNGTIVYTDDVSGISLDPLGDQETLAFASYDFQDEGVFGLKFNFPLASDDVPSNNVKSLGIGIDKTKPVSTHAISPATPDGLNGWYISDVTITLTATDPEVNGVHSGVAKIEYQVDGGSWQTYTAPFKVTTDNGAHVVNYRATDKVGNVETQKTIPSFKIDKTVPIIAMNYTWEKVGSKYNIIMTATGTDAMSGMAKVEFYFNGELQETVTGAGPDYVWTYEYAPLTTVHIKAIAYDNAGWTADVTIDNPHSAQSQTTQSATPITHPVVK